MNRTVATLALLVASVAIPFSVTRGVPIHSARAAQPPGVDGPGMDVSGMAKAQALQVPGAVRAAAEAGRYWRASRLMADHLATVSDTAPATILATARLHAGWDHWTGVGRLLEGRPWLDTLEGGAGWELLGRSRVASGRFEDGAAAFRRYLEVTELESRQRAEVELRRGLALGRAGAADSAMAAFDRTAAALPSVADWAHMFGARVAAEVGDTAAVRRRLADAGWIPGDDAWRLRLQAALESGDSLAARQIALATARSSTSANTRSTAWARLGELRMAAGDTARARAAFVEALDAPASVGAVNAARALTALDPTPEERLRIADIYARHGNQARAVSGYEAYLASGAAAPDERWSIRYRLARARFNAGSYGEAERELLALAGEESVPAGIGARALYLAGRAQYRQGRSDDGQRTLARLSERFPGQDAVTEGLYLLADLKHDDLEIGDARRYYREAAEANPSLNEAGLSLMRLGGLEMLEEDYTGAAEIYEEYRRLHPEGRRWNQATYWAAKAYRAMGRADTAEVRLRELRERDPISYYGVRAAELLGEGVLEVPMAAAPVTDPASSARVRKGFEQVDLLAALGQREDLVREVDRLRSTIEGQEAAEYALGEALAERGYTLSAINLGWEIYRRTRTWNPRLLRIVYPFPFRSMVLGEARDRGLDPYLVAGLIRRESAFNPTVSSSAGAIGLMQIMPPTGRSLASETGLRDFEPELLRQPEVNTHLGTLYLKTMLDRYDQELPLVLSAYNAGPTRAERWKSLPESRDPELFAERVPYSETRDYIRHVLMHRALYRSLYPDLDTSGD